MQQLRRKRCELRSFKGSNNGSLDEGRRRAHGGEGDRSLEASGGLQLSFNANLSYEMMDLLLPRRGGCIEGDQGDDAGKLGRVAGQIDENGGPETRRVSRPPRSLSPAPLPSSSSLLPPSLLLAAAVGTMAGKPPVPLFAPLSHIQAGHAMPPHSSLS